MVLFTSPRSFKRFYHIQHNAIQSWVRLKCVSKIVLISDDDCVKDYAETHKFVYEPDVVKNKFGTPLVNSIFSLAYKHVTRSELACYANSDIIFLPDFDVTISAFIKFLDDRPGLMIGRRWRWHDPYHVNFKNNWHKKLRKEVKSQKDKTGPRGLDYFVHTLGIFKDIPDFAIGRTTWDAWLQHQATSNKDVITVDATRTVFAIHQEHDKPKNEKEIEINLSLWKRPKIGRKRPKIGKVGTLGVNSCKFRTFWKEKDVKLIGVSKPASKTVENV